MNNDDKACQREIVNGACEADLFRSKFYVVKKLIVTDIDEATAVALGKPAPGQSQAAIYIYGKIAGEWLDASLSTRKTEWIRSTPMTPTVTSLLRMR